jgi:hypothetical protein
VREGKSWFDATRGGLPDAVKGHLLGGVWLECGHAPTRPVSHRPRTCRYGRGLSDGTAIVIFGRCIAGGSEEDDLV